MATSAIASIGATLSTEQSSRWVIRLEFERRKVTIGDEYGDSGQLSVLTGLKKASGGNRVTSAGMSSPSSSKTSRYKSMASAALARASSSVSPWVTKPGRAGQVTT